MAQYKVSDIVGDVRLVLDQNQFSEAMDSFGDLDTSDLDEVIYSKIEDAATLILSSAPVHKLDGGSYMNTRFTHYGSVDEKSDAYAMIPLPSDYLRLLYVSFPDWSKVVSEGITTEDPQYNLQRSRIRGVRGTPEKPVVALAPLTFTIDNFDGNGKCLECYSTSASNPTVRYIKKPKIKAQVDGGAFYEIIEIPEDLYRSIVYMIGYLTATAFGSETQATMLLSVAKDLADINERVQSPVIPQQVEQQDEQ